MTRSDPKDEFFVQIASPMAFTEAFNLLDNVYFFVKDRDGRFVSANTALIKALGYQNEQNLLDKTDFDVFEESLAAEYREEDERVMASGTTLADQVWLVPSQTGELNWYLSTKSPLFDDTGSVIGILGVMRDFEQAGSTLDSYRMMTNVISYVKSHFAEKLEMTELASRVNLSLSQFERRFKALFQCTPIQYLNQVRIHAAARRLIETGDPIGEIAVDCGFYDQSHFTKVFRREKGTTPSGYRKQRAALQTKGRGIGSR